jgi:TorA maturation chaperone TorD
MESILKIPEPIPWRDLFAPLRAESYLLLAALLIKPPSAELMGTLSDLHWEGLPPSPDRDLYTLCQIARICSPADVAEEYHTLFVGLGRGEIMPYASWYKDNRFHSRPLVFLRSDLMNLGLTRQTDCFEPEDHAGALCEIMALITHEICRAEYAAQAGFFQNHLNPWLPAFFKDLQSAKSARFYRQVGCFGSSFIEFESQFLKGFE